MNSEMTLYSWKIERIYKKSIRYNKGLVMFQNTKLTLS